MRKLMVLVLLVCASSAARGAIPANFEALHDISRIGRLSSTNEIAQYFRDNSLSFETPALKRHADRYFWVVSYPYSGMDTIDLYCFRGGPRGWTVQMLYFALRPTDRHINIIEEESQFVVKNGGKQLLTFAVEL